MTQSRRHSFVEAVLNTASGMIISFAAGLIVFPMYGMKTNLADNAAVTAIFTVLSVVRSYVWRRAFNHFHRIGK